MRNAAALLCGLVFGAGLALSGMTDTRKVLGFLDLFGAWIPDLAFVMGAAVAVTLVSFRFILRRPVALCGDALQLPGATHIDRRLILGSALFGIGWGLYGYCPGPALSALSYLDWQPALFVLSMIAGMALVRPAQ